MREKMTFYELQQKAGSSWNHVGFYRTKEAVKEASEEFNTKTLVYPLRILKRNFIG